MTRDTVFDVASLTKAVATAPVGDDPRRGGEDSPRRPGRPLPAGVRAGRRGTGEDHGRRVAHAPRGVFARRPDRALHRLSGRDLRPQVPPAARPGAGGGPSSTRTWATRFWESSSGAFPASRSTRFAARRIFRPLGMRDTAFLPLAAGMPAARIAPTEKREGRWMRGEVHDPRAYALGGVAGHAGLFSTARGSGAVLPHDPRRRPARKGAGPLAALRRGAHAAARLRRRRRPVPRLRHGDGLSRAIAATSTRRDRSATRDSPGPRSGSIPSSRSFVVFLSNRVHPDGKGDVGRLRGLVATIAAAALPEDDACGGAPPLGAACPTRARCARGSTCSSKTPSVRSRESAWAWSPTRRAGRGTAGRRSRSSHLRSRQEGRGRPRAPLFARARDRVRRGRGGRRRDGSRRRSSRSSLSTANAGGRGRRTSRTSTPSSSTSRTSGTRFYTYVTTLGYVLEEAAKAKVRVVVLDRPDPIGGTTCEGPFADPERLSFTAYGSIPVRYGLTPGELARFVERESGGSARDLRVVAMRGWSRGLWYDETGLEWVDPLPTCGRSPRRRSIRASACSRRRTSRSAAARTRPSR